MLSKLLKTEKVHQPVPVRPIAKTASTFLCDTSNGRIEHGKSDDEGFYVGSLRDNPSIENFERSQTNLLVDPKLYIGSITTGSLSDRRGHYHVEHSNDQPSLSDETSISDGTDGYATEEELESFNIDGDLPFDLAFKQSGVYTPYEVAQMEIKEASRSKASSTLSGRTDSSMSTCSSICSPRPASEFELETKKSSSCLFSDLSLNDLSNGSCSQPQLSLAHKPSLDL